MFAASNPQIRPRRYVMATRQNKENVQDETSRFTRPTRQNKENVQDETSRFTRPTRQNNEKYLASLADGDKQQATQPKKRAALGDVSNVQPASRQTATTKASAAPVTRQRFRRPTVSGIVKPLAEVSQNKQQDPVAKLAKKTRQAITESAVVEPEEESNAVVPSKGPKPSATKNAVAAKKAKDTHVPPEHTTEDVDAHVSKKAKTVDMTTIEALENFDPIMAGEYAEEIFEYMRQTEVETLPNPDYMGLQKELQWKMRSILVDWLIEVHHKFRLEAETLYLTVNIIDRFLSVRVVSLVKLQLVGVTAMFIASKFEEVTAPSIQNFLYMADGGYTDDEILRAERYILQVLDFALQYPSPMSFLRRGSRADSYDLQTRTLAKYLMEVSLIDHRFLKMRASMIAASALYLARRMLDRGEWTDELVHYAGYEEKELLECAELTLDYLSKPVKFEALHKKYSSRKFMKAAIFAQDWMQHYGKTILLRSSSCEEKDDSKNETKTTAPMTRSKSAKKTCTVSKKHTSSRRASSADKNGEEDDEDSVHSSEEVESDSSL